MYKLDSRVPFQPLLNAQYCSMPSAQPRPRDVNLRVLIVLNSPFPLRVPDSPTRVPAISCRLGHKNRAGIHFQNTYTPVIWKHLIASITCSKIICDPCVPWYLQLSNPLSQSSEATLFENGRIGGIGIGGTTPSTSAPSGHPVPSPSIHSHLSRFPAIPHPTFHF